MERRNVVVGTYGVNCSVLNNGAETWIVDPGADAGEIIRVVDGFGTPPGGILLTHGHFDHIGAVAALQSRWPELPVFIHPDDMPMLGHRLNCMPPDYPLQNRPANLRDCREQTFASVIETPGHTPGGVCYHFPESSLLLSGDTLFAGSVGRTDFPGGNMQELLASLAKLELLPDATLVIPGHGSETTIALEKRRNPYMP